MIRQQSFAPMKRHILICGIGGGLLVALLKWSEYQFLVIDRSIEIYAGLIAAIFAFLGIVLGLKLTRTKERVVVKEVFVPAPFAAEPSTPAVVSFVADGRKRDDLGITPRELEVLQLVARGKSNREIAGELFVSENTVKTHCSRAFEKLGARRRTEAVQLGKEFGLLP